MAAFGLFTILAYLTMAWAQGSNKNPSSKVAPLSEALLEEFVISQPAKLSGRIAFTATINGIDRILSLDLDANKIRIIVDGPGNNSFPTWSPDGKRLAFTSDRDGNKEIYTSDWEGGNLKRFTKNTVTDDNASWSPNGRNLAYYSETGMDQANIFTISSDGKNPTKVGAFTGRNTTPRWSPDAQFIAYSTNRFWPGWDICTLNLFRKKETCLLRGGQTFCRPMYSRSGQQLAYSFGMFEEIDIGILDIETNSTTVETSLPGKEYDVVWSPDEKYLAFTAENGQTNLFNIYLKEIGAKDALLLLKSPYSVRYLSWSGVKTIDLEAGRIRDKQIGDEKNAS